MKTGDNHLSQECANANAKAFSIRPYQLMCLICRLGREGNTEYHFERHLDAIQKSIWDERDLPLRMVCNVESTFCFQNPGRAYDTPEGDLFNVRRDLTILQQLGLTPGAEYPATDLIRLMVREITSCENICQFKETTSPIWQGCKFAATGNYERGVRDALKKLVRTRSEEELATCKQQSADIFMNRKMLEIRPHHLLCMACFTGAKEGDAFKPIPNDHLYEAVIMCRRHPEMPIKLVAGPCMICEPCPGFHPDTGVCSADFGMGLRDQKKDLDTLQALGLAYGDVLPAAELFRRLFEKIKNLTHVCGFINARRTGPAWTICSGEGQLEGRQCYQDARSHGLSIPSVKKQA